ncbi:MAG: choice-of-anchor J domain-containing protein [Prevotella sp.]|nr:choice-of-anchor J domain-containing protein [Prevotella sp.]
MSKKFTSFLVVLAALLLTVPTQAQLAKKAARQQVTLQAGPLKANDVRKVKAAKAKAESKLEGQAFRGFKSVFQEKNVLPQYESTSGLFKPRFCESFMEMSAMNTERVTPLTRRASGEEKDANGIITSPAEGVAKVYTRSGKAYKYANSAVSVIDQSGTTQIVECEDGTVYIKDIVASYATGAWVKGTKSGNTITVPTKQPINYNSQYGATLSPRWATGDGTANPVAADELADNFTFVVDEAANTISLQNTTATQFMAVLWDDDNSYTGNGVYETVYTYSNDYVPPTTVTVTPPTDLETATWYANGHTYSSGSLSPYTNQVSVGFAEDKVYIKGMFTSFPNAWMMGTIEGTTVTFAGLQFQGVYGGTYDIYATGGDNSGLKDYVMTYDALSGTLSSENALFANAATDKIYYLTYITDITITKGTPTESEATTGDPIDALPYTNTLGTEDEFAQFGVIDSNSDGKTWIFSADNGTYYGYSSANAADDWLISPAIKLEAGKKYHFAIDAASASTSYPEVFEVLIGTEPKASALKQSVLAATQVASKEFATYENETVEVAETGYYHFGIHAISDANMWNLFVANFLVEAGVEATAPAAVTDLAVAQTPDKLEAVVSFKAPTKTAAGEDLTDLTKIDVLRDGAVVKSIAGSAEWVAAAQGYEDSENITSIDLGAGATAALSAGTNTSNAPRYWAADQTLRLYNGNTLTITGNDIKKVVVTFGSSSNNKLTAEGFVVDGTTGTWTGSANEIAFSATAKAFIKSIVIETAGLTPGAEYSVVDAEGLTVGKHVYQVIPYNTTGVGVKSEEKSIFISVSLEAPYTFDFSQNLLDLFTVIDNNEDGKTWSWNASSAVANYSYSSDNDADDYLITLPFNLKAGKRYNVVVNAKGSESFPERFEVVAGKDATVAGLTEQVIAPTDLNIGEFDDYEGVFAPEEDGQYYFAIHAISDADQLNLQVKTLAIEIAPEFTAPAAIADFAVAAGAEGALEANLSFTAPAKAINGNALEGNVDVKIYRDNELVNTLTGVAAGSAQSWKDTNVENGKIYTYYVVAANESGDGLKSEKVSTFIGIDEVGDVANILVTGTTANTISLKWDEVAGKNGGYVNLADVKYAVVSMHVETYWIMQYLVIDDVLGTVTGATSGTFSYPVDEGVQDWSYIGVVALQGDAAAPEAGSEYAGGYTAVLVGSPYTMPFVESFANQTLAYDIWTYGGAEDTYVSLTDDASDDDGGAVLMTTYEAPGTARFESGKIKIEGANPTLIFDAKATGITSGKIMASVDDAEWTVVKSFDVTDTYQPVKVSLLNAKGERFTRIAFAADIVNPSEYQGQDPSTGANIFDWKDVLYIDNIKVVDLYEYNLVADIKAPKSVVAGQKAKIVATVTNAGENPVKDYVVSITAGNKALTNVIGDKELAPFTKDIIEVDYETSIFDETGDVTLTVNVQYENELLPEDNTASAIITITEPAATAPTSLLAEDKGAAGVDLTWTVAEGGVAEITESFDDASVFEPFGLGGITADQHTGAFGDWTVYDGNGIGTYGFDGTDFPNAYQPMGFIVFNPSQVSEALAETYAPHSGDQFMMSFCPADQDEAGNTLTPAADHWMISPVLPGVSQTISFYARALTNQYGAETFEVLASSTDKEVASFTKVADFSTDATEWTEFTADLPAGTKYFAIRHTATDVFGLLVDDVTFMTAGGAEAPASFNIYLASEQIANVEGDKTTYTVAADKLTIGENTFAVTAVYANGAESKPVTATITITTDIRQIAADGKAVDVYSVDGKLVRSQATSLDGLKGLYIVNGKVVMVK